uniref:Uncharacterized protein n=1 Tax=Cucumis melo TaxID=3656 RepID=A0A9I9EG55_CUCME
MRVQTVTHSKSLSEFGILPSPEPGIHTQPASRELPEISTSASSNSSFFIQPASHCKVTKLGNLPSPEARIHTQQALHKLSGIPTSD